MYKMFSVNGLMEKQLGRDTNKFPVMFCVFCVCENMFFMPFIGRYAFGKSCFLQEWRKWINLYNIK